MILWAVLRVDRLHADFLCIPCNHGSPQSLRPTSYYLNRRLQLIWKHPASSARLQAVWAHRGSSTGDVGSLTHPSQPGSYTSRHASQWSVLKPQWYRVTAYAGGVMTHHVDYLSPMADETWVHIATLGCAAALTSGRHNGNTETCWKGCVACDGGF